MKEVKYRIKELVLFKNGCDIEFLKSLRSYRCYVTKEGMYIVVMQFENTYSIILDQVVMVQKDGTMVTTTVTPVEVQIDKKYSLYEIEE